MALADTTGPRNVTLEQSVGEMGWRAGAAGSFGRWHDPNPEVGRRSLPAGPCLSLIQLLRRGRASSPTVKCKANSGKVNSYQLQAIMGHKDSRSTQIYVQGVEGLIKGLWD
jgi:hypothetical protein